MHTLLRHFATNLARLIIAATILGAVFLIHPATTVAAPSPTRAETLMEAHGCWSGAAPVDMEGKLPGHVVVSVGDRTVYAGAAMVGKALDQTFNGHDHGLWVGGFCR